MKEVSLSIEELIYSFYSEGYFEQGNAFKQMYFPDLTDENMDQLLQTTCRSLLAKGVLDYTNHKFTLKEDLSALISALNFSEQSLKASRHHQGGEEESLSIHIKDGQFIQHTLHFDDQVHSFKNITKDEAVGILGEFFQISSDGEQSIDRLKISRKDFEGLLDLIEQKNYHSPNLSNEEASFMKVLAEGNGLLNTIIFMEFKENREPEAKEVVLFTNKDKDNWIVEQDDQAFYVGPGTESAITRIFDRHMLGIAESMKGQ